jgi:hypothetical protein
VSKERDIAQAKIGKNKNGLWGLPKVSWEALGETTKVSKQDKQAGLLLGLV